RGLDVVVVVVRVGEVEFDGVIELVEEVAVHAEAGPAEEGGRGVLHAVAAAAGDGEEAQRGDQPGRVDLGVAADVDVEAGGARLEGQGVVPGRVEVERVLVRVRGGDRDVAPAVGGAAPLGDLSRDDSLWRGGGHLLGRRRGRRAGRVGGHGP